MPPIEPPTRLLSLHFPGPPLEDSVPNRVVADFPADILYTLACITGRMPPILFTPAASNRLSEFYDFVTDRVANRFYEEGLNGAAPKYEVHNTQYKLAYHEVGSKHPDAPQQQLAENLFMSIGDHFGESADAQTNHERRELAEVLAQTVINFGWRKLSEIR